MPGAPILCPGFPNLGLVNATFMVKLVNRRILLLPKRQFVVFTEWPLALRQSPSCAIPASLRPHVLLPGNSTGIVLTLKGG